MTETNMATCIGPSLFPDFTNIGKPISIVVNWIQFYELLFFT